MRTTTLLIAALPWLAACGAGSEPTTVAGTSRTAGAVTAERLLSADAEPGQWLSTGRTYDEQRFSPLAEIDTTNVGELGLAWYGDLRMSRAQEATPLFVDGVLYVTTAWSNVQAYDARSGAQLWSFDARGAARVGQPRVLRRRQPRRCRLERQDFRRHARRPLARARCRDGHAGVEHGHARPARRCLHDHGRAARREGQGHHRQRRRRVRRARLRLGVRRRDRRARVALLHRARRS